MSYFNAIIFTLLIASNIFGYEIDLVYSKHYNYDLGEYANLDYFTAKNYQKTANYILKNGSLIFSRAHRLFHEVTVMNFGLMLDVHDAEYVNLLQSIDKSSFSNSKAVIELLAASSFNNIALNLRRKKEDIEVFDVAREIIRAQRLGAQGTFRATELVLDPATAYGRAAINLSGGYHHASKNYGSGYCLINDMAIAIKHILKTRNDYKVLIVDLDAHFGDGNYDIFKDESRVIIFDMFNKEIFPFHRERKIVPNKEKRRYLYALTPQMDDDEYLALLSSELHTTITSERPDIVFYNAGTDVYKHDPLGGLAITSAGIIKRDEIVFNEALNNYASIVMVLSGGYATGTILSNDAEDIFDIIGQSIINLKIKFGKPKVEKKPSIPVLTNYARIKKTKEATIKNQSRKRKKPSEKIQAQKKKTIAKKAQLTKTKKTTKKYKRPKKRRRSGNCHPRA